MSSVAFNPSTHIGSQNSYTSISPTTNPFSGQRYKYDRPLGDGVLQLIQNVRTQDMTITNERWQRTTKAISFAAGDSSDYGFATQGGTPFDGVRPTGYTFNVIEPRINIICGMQRQHRRSLQAQSNYPSGNDIATKYSRLFVHNDNKKDLGHKFSLGFEKGVITGLAFSEVILDHSNDLICGDIDLRLWEYNSFIFDYTCRDIWGLTDLKYLWCQAYVDKRKAMAQYPEAAHLIEGFGPGAYGNPVFMFLPEAITPRQQDVVVMSRFWSKVNVKQPVWIDLNTGISHFKRPEYLSNFKYVEIAKEVARLTVLVNDQIVSEEIAPNGLDCMPFIAHTWDYWPELQAPSSRVRGMADWLTATQWMLNRRMVINHDTCETSINSGLLFEEDSLVDEDVQRRAGQGRNIAYNKGSPIPQQIQPVALPQSNFELVNQLILMSDKITNISDSLTGVDTQSKSGLMEMIRQDSATVGLQKYFDDADRSLTRLGYLQMELMQKNWTAHKMARILNCKPEETAELFDTNLKDFSIVISEGVYTDIQKRTEFINAVEVCAMAGIKAPPKYLLEKAPIQGTNELIAAIEQQEKQNQDAQMQQLAVELAVKEAEISLIKAKSVEQLNLAISHKARSKSYVGLEHERNAEVIKNTSVSNKNNAEAIIKIAPLIEKYGEHKFYEILSKLANSEDNIELEGPDVKISYPHSLQESSLEPQGNSGPSPQGNATGIGLSQD